MTFTSNWSPADLEERLDAVRVATRSVTDRFPHEWWIGRARAKESALGIVPALVDAGLLGLGIAESHGGAGGGVSEVVALMEALATAGSPVAFPLLTGMVCIPVLRYGTQDQIDRWVKPTLLGELRMSFAITEPDAGTNSLAITTRATERDGGWTLHGQKVFTTAADEAQYMMVVARTAPYDAERRTSGLSLFIIDADSPGLQLEPIGIDICVPERHFMVFLDDVEAPADLLVGEPGHAMDILFDVLNPERLGTAALAIGTGYFALKKGVEYAKERAPFGKPIGSYQAVQHPLARAKVQLDAARLMMYDAAARFDAGESAAPQSNMAKLLGVEAAWAALNAAIQCHGGHAFTHDHGLGAFLGWIRLQQIAPINNEMVLNYIGQHVLGLPKSY